MKLGPHTLIPTAQALAWAGRAPIVKAVNDPRSLLAAHLGAITIFRYAFTTQAEQDAVSPQRFLDLTLSHLAGYVPTFIEGLNEHRAKREFGLAEYIDWTAEYCRLAHAAGYRVAGFSFPTGNPEAEDWFLLRDKNFGGVDAISQHAYWGMGGPLASEWNACRHRWMHKLLNGHHPPVILSEVGRDAVSQEGASGMPGWQLQGISHETYAAELLEFGDALDADDYVLGATVFTSGAPEDWQAFDIDEISHWMPGGVAPTIPQEVTVPEWKLAFETYAELHTEVGEPITDLMYDDQGNAWQYSDKGMLFSAKGEGWKIYWHPKA